METSQTLRTAGTASLRAMHVRSTEVGGGVLGVVGDRQVTGVRRCSGTWPLERWRAGSWGISPLDGPSPTECRQEVSEPPRSLSSETVLFFALSSTTQHHGFGRSQIEAKLHARRCVRLGTVGRGRRSGIANTTIQHEKPRKPDFSEITPFIWMHIGYLSGNSLNHFFRPSSRCARPLKGWPDFPSVLLPFASLSPSVLFFALSSTTQHHGSDEVRSRPSSTQDAARGWEKWEEGEEEAASDLPSPHIEEGRSSWGEEDASMAPRHGCASGHQEVSVSEPIKKGRVRKREAKSGESSREARFGGRGGGCRG